MTKEFEVKQDAEKAALLKDVVTAGAILKAAREAKGLSIEAVAAQLHLRPGIISDIEKDIFDNIASTTYVRGYVKNYARFVNADNSEIQQCLNHQLPEIVPPAMQSFSRKTTQQARNSRLNLVTYLIVTILIAMLVLWWVQKSSLLTDVDVSLPTAEEIAADTNMAEPQQIIRPAGEQAEPDTQVTQGNNAASAITPTNNGASTEVAAPATGALVTGDTPTATSLDVPNSASTVTNQLTTSTLDPAPTSTLNQPSVESVSTAANSASNNKPVSTNSAAANTSSEGTLAIELTGDCWINVTDANGKVLVDGVKTAANTVEVRGVKPFKVILGAPQVANVSLDGSKISLAEFANGRVARLTLPEAE